MLQLSEQEWKKRKKYFVYCSNIHGYLYAIKASYSWMNGQFALSCIFFKSDWFIVPLSQQWCRATFQHHSNFKLFENTSGGLFRILRSSLTAICRRFIKRISFKHYPWYQATAKFNRNKSFPCIYDFWAATDNMPQVDNLRAFFKSRTKSNLTWLGLELFLTRLAQL